MFGGRKSEDFIDFFPCVEHIHLPILLQKDLQMECLINNEQFIIILGDTSTLDEDTYIKLNREGYIILFASDDKGLVALCHNHSNILVIIIDGDVKELSLPQLDNAIKETSIHKYKLVLLSSFRISAMKQALMYGFDEFIAKPISFNEFRALLIKSECDRIKLLNTITNHKTRIS